MPAAFLRPRVWTVFRQPPAPDALARLLKMCPWAAYDTAVARPHLSDPHWTLRAAADRAFAEVIAGCAEPRRTGGGGAWRGFAAGFA